MHFEIEKLKGGYHGIPVLEDVSFSLHSGQIVYVIGANGCGKTTLFNMIVGALPVWEGQIRADSKSLVGLPHRQMAHLVAYIPQEHVPAFNYSVEQIVVMGRAAHIAPFASPGKRDYEMVHETLHTLGIDDLAHKSYMNLSGGQRQLVLIARALVQQAQLVLMDEPLQSLDMINQAMVMGALEQLLAAGRAVMMSTHSAIHAISNGAKALLMDKHGSAVFGDLEAVMTKERIENAYEMPVSTFTVHGEDGAAHLLCLPVQP